MSTIWRAILLMASCVPVASDWPNSGANSPEAKRRVTSGSMETCRVGEDAACPEVFPRDFDGELHLQFALVVLGRRAQHGLADAFDLHAQLGVGGLILGESKRGALLDLLLHGLGELELRAAAKILRDGATGT